jgi:hypothetical protein
MSGTWNPNRTRPELAASYSSLTVPPTGSSSPFRTSMMSSTDPSVPTAMVPSPRSAVAVVCVPESSR